VLFVMANVPPAGGDALLQQRLIDRGLEVVAADDDRLMNVDITGVGLILISQSAATNAVGTRYRTVPKPVVVCEPLLFDDFGLVTTNPAGNRGTTPNVTMLRIDTPESPLAAGLSGTVTVSTAPGDAVWGMPSNTAIRVASVPGQPMQLAIFAYENGVQMAELPAPARRVGLFVSMTLSATLSPSGGALFDAAVAWALGR
jgi:hypothetical protein